MNIGCGRDIRPEPWRNIDISNEIPVDHRMDIRKDVIPWSDGSITEIFISGVLEQIGPNEELIHAMNECWRVLKPTGQIVIVVPNAKHAIAHRDPMDVRKFTIPTFNYFIDGMQEYRDYGSVYGFKPWRTLDIQENERHILTVTMSK